MANTSVIRKLLYGLDLDGSSLINFLLEEFTTATLPSQKEKRIIWDATTKSMKYSDGTNWLEVQKTLSASDLLTMIKTVDGDTSGLDADTLKGLAPGANSGLATLDANGKLTSGQIPAIAITDTFPVASEEAMLALTCEVGDVCIRTDLSKSFILKTAGPDTLANWTELLSPTTGVTTVNGLNGTVTLDTDDIGEGSTNLYFTTERAQDAVGAMIIDTNSIDVTYTDETPELKFDVKCNSATMEVSESGINVKSGVFAAASHDHTGDVVSGTIGDGEATDITITHSLNTRNVDVSFYRNSSPYDEVGIYFERATVDTIVAKFQTAPTTNQYAYVISKK